MRVRGGQPPHLRGCPAFHVAQIGLFPLPLPLTDKGLSLELTGKGTKYSKDDDLNKS